MPTGPCTSLGRTGKHYLKSNSNCEGQCMIGLDEMERRGSFKNFRQLTTLEIDLRLETPKATEQIRAEQFLAQLHRQRFEKLLQRCP